LTLEYRGQYTSREVGETTHHGVSTLSFELTKRFDLDVSFIWDRISNSRGGLGQRSTPAGRLSPRRRAGRGFLSGNVNI